MFVIYKTNFDIIFVTSNDFKIISLQKKKYVKNMKTL